MLTLNSLFRMPRVPVLIAGLALVSAFAQATPAATADEVEAKLNALALQVSELQTELAALKAQQQTAAAMPAAQPASAPAASEASTKQLEWFGYGELNYSRPSGNKGSTSADVGRFVLGASFRFDDKTRLASELELEHAVASSTDPGEMEVEQAYIERQLGNSTYAKMGLFLIPVGFLNENHEPTRYYGVFRNFVETAIIPTTWREGGFAVRGDTSSGLRWDVGVSTGFDLSKWDATASDGLQAPLGSIHQELALARAGDLAGFGALNYTGLPGLRLGGSVFSGGASQGQPGFDHNRITLWEGHARWNPGNWDFSALYARGHIANTRPINLTLVGNPTLIPESFFGWYAEAAYRATLPNLWMLAPFARYERFNTASSYASLGAGLTPAPLDDESVLAAGANLEIAPGVVVKLDYLRFKRDVAKNRFDLGVGYQF